MPPKKIKPIPYTLRDIHSVALEQQTLKNTANALKIPVNTLTEHLKVFSYTYRDVQTPLLFVDLLSFWPTTEKAEKFWGNLYDRDYFSYNQFLNKRVFTLHSTILMSESIEDAANSLQIDVAALEEVLSSFFYYNLQGERCCLTYDSIKVLWPTASAASALWGSSYNRSINGALLEFQQRSADACLQIMEHVEISPSPENPVYPVYSEPEFEKLAQVSLEYSCLREIHRVCLLTKNYQNTLDFFGVTSEKFTSHLSRYTYTINETTIPLSFLNLILDCPTEESAEKYWGDNYDLHFYPIPLVVLLEKHFSTFISTIILSSTIDEAATRLGQDALTLTQLLGRIVYFDKYQNKLGMTYDLVKRTWPTVEHAQSFWGTFYNSSLKVVLDQYIGVVLTDKSQEISQNLQSKKRAGTSLGDTPAKIFAADAPFSNHLFFPTVSDSISTDYFEQLGSLANQF